MYLKIFSFVNFDPYNTLFSLALYCFALILLCHLFTGLRHDQMGEPSLKLIQVILMAVSAFWKINVNLPGYIYSCHCSFS